MHTTSTGRPWWASFLTWVLGHVDVVPGTDATPVDLARD
eukprot:COSAG02_NODE_46931_length_345_cov_0.617886_1_plen_38_part_10